jgi:hypothetical protein
MLRGARAFDKALSVLVIHRSMVTVGRLERSEDGHGP